MIIYCKIWRCKILGKPRVISYSIHDLELSLIVAFDISNFSFDISNFRQVHDMFATLSSSFRFKI